MKKVVLHVGHGKTGSSYLQSCLALNKDKLLDLGIVYPSHKSFEEALSGYISSGNGKNFIEILSDLKTSSDNILFSSELLFGSLLNEEKVKFCDLLGSAKYSFEVIIYSRNLFEHSFSRWGQMVKREKCVDDLNTYLLKNPVGPHPTILEWIELSERYDFKLKIKNYSKIKGDLATQFLSDLTGLEGSLFSTPQFQKVNRSLTSAETIFKRFFNSVGFPHPPLSDELVNRLPEITIHQPSCTRKVYDLVVDMNSDAFEIINKNLSYDESLEIEGPQQVVYNGFSEDSHLSAEQVSIISEYLSRHFIALNKSEVDIFRDIAIKISRNKAQLIDALLLMEFALKHRPNGPLIKKHVERWKEKLS